MPPAARPFAASPFAIFRQRSFTLLWTAQFVSTLGAGLASIASSILVYRATESALSVGLMLLVTSAPSIAVGLFAGVLVDRIDRRRIMVAADLLRAALVAAIPLALPLGLPWLYLLTLLASAASQFFDPAQESLLPEIAPEAQVAAASSLMTVSSVGAWTFGCALAGVIAQSYPLEWAFTINATTFLISAACIALMRVPRPETSSDTSAAAVLRNLRAGLGYVRATPALRSLFLGFLPFAVVTGFQVAALLPFSAKALGASELEYGALEGVGTIGFVVGSLLMAKLAARLHQGQWIAISIIGMGLTSTALALAGSVPLAIAVYVLNNFFNAPSTIGRRLLTQQHTPRELRGRVSSAFLVMREAGFMIGMAAVGLADVLDVQVLYLGSGLALTAAGLLTLALPGLGQPSAEWRRIVRMLRSAPEAPALGLGRAALAADVDRLAVHMPLLAELGAADRRQLADRARVFEVAAGTRVVAEQEAGDAAYFLIAGRTAASRRAEGGEEVVMEVHSPGDFFGEIAALMGLRRTASVLAVEPSVLLQVPAPALRDLTGDARLHRALLSKMTERMVRMDLIESPRLGGLDQQALRELRTPDEGAR